MTVRDLGFHPYTAGRTPLASRFFVITRYALREALAKKRTLVFLVAAALVPLAAATIIYLHHNSEAIGIFGIDVRRLLLPRLQ